jgi:DNA repair protein RadA
MLEFRNGLDLLSERQAFPKLTTGYADLDSLLGGGVEPGQFYLFYGDKKSGVDTLIHQILVNSLLPIDRFGFGGKCVYSNCGNYREDRTMLDTHLLCYLVKSAGLEPNKALNNIYAICSYSEEQEEHVFEEVQRLLKKDSLIRLLVVHNIARLFTMKTRTPNKNGGKRIMRFQRVVGWIQQVCAENNLALVSSCRPVAKGWSYGIPKPEGGKYLSHKATVIVYFRKRSNNLIQAYLIKHPNRKPRNIRFGGDSSSRTTHSFRLIIQEEICSLKRTFREALMDTGRRDAFESLICTWGSEQDAMNCAKVPTALDIMLLTAVIDNRKIIKEIQNQIAVITLKLRIVNSKLEEIFY